VEAISDLPMLDDMDADYSPQYVKLARILRDKIESGHYLHGDHLPVAGLAADYGYPHGWHRTRSACSPRTGTSTRPAVSPPTA
jgi:hypothetical protein